MVGLFVALGVVTGLAAAAYTPPGLGDFVGGRFAALPFDDAQPGSPARLCLILGARALSGPSCAAGHNAVEITGLPRGTGAGEVTVADVGDVNGGRFGDIAVSDSAASFDGRAHSGVTWVVFGTAHPTVINLAHLGKGGFEIGGPRAGAQTGVEDESQGPGVGDVSGDGFDSIVLSSRNSPSTDSDMAWVVFGKRGDAPVDLAHLGSDGFEIEGTNGASPTIIGDVTGNGHAAVAISGSGNGQISVVYGSGSSATVRLGSLGARGFRISGLDSVVGGTIAGVGDLTGDGLADMLVGNPWSGGECGPNAPILTEICPGQAYVIYGERADENINVQRLGSHGYRIASSSGATDGLGSTVAAAGDVNGDGRPGLLIGDNAHAYVIFGRAAGGPIDLDKLRQSSCGFVITFPLPSGIALGPGVGPPVADVGDLTADGRSDILVEPTSTNGTTTDFYVVYGKTSSAPVDLAHLGGDGFQIH
ncbi:MAG: VCBS repeat-containing protein [Solirubrobacteraceae bacterium]|jgi:hypothetical protein